MRGHLNMNFIKRVCGEFIQLLKAYRIKFQNFAAHAHKDALINETFISA